MRRHHAPEAVSAGLRRVVLLVALLNLAYFGLEFGVALAIGSGASAILAVPCCQAELAQQLRGNHSLAELLVPAAIDQGLLRRGLGELLTDALRIELLEAYAFKEGNLWPLVLVVVLLAPLAAALWQAKSARAALAALAVLVLAAWTPEAAALDRAGAIEAAKRQMGSRCNAATPCGFEAKLEGDRWHVRVEFLKDDTAPGKPAAGARTHAIYIFNQSGRVVGTIKGK